MTCNNKNYDALAKITAPTKQLYCERYGLAFEHLKFEGNQNDVCWDKARLTSEMLNKYDAVIYMDCDVAIINQNFDIRPFIEEYELILTTDLNGINAGVYIAQSTDLVKQLWYCVNTWGKMFFGQHPWRDQECLKHYLANHNSSFC